MSQAVSEMPASVPACVFLLADHLDAALAAGEDLVAVGQSWDDGDPCDPGVAGTQRWAIGRIRAHEMTLLSRILRARDRASELSQEDTRFKLLAHLFVSGTADLTDAVAETCDLTECAFKNGDDAMAYLRSRGLLDDEAPGLKAGQALNLGDDFLVVGRIPLGIVLDLVSEFLETLDMYFSLYPSEDARDGDGAADLDVDGGDVDVVRLDDDDGEAAIVEGADVSIERDALSVADADDSEDHADTDDDEAEAKPPTHVLTVAGMIPMGGVERPSA